MHQPTGEMDLTVYTDGAARGNPGEAGIGVVIYKGSQRLKTISKYLGQLTNNQAEYQALITALESVREYPVQTITIKSDSELMVRQINSLYRVKDKNLFSLYQKVMELLKNFSDYRILHIPRIENKEADTSANLAIDHKLT